MGMAWLYAARRCKPILALRMEQPSPATARRSTLILRQTLGITAPSVLMDPEPAVTLNETSVDVCSA
ncbi:MAG: hypothetical protein AMJ93_09175 [Anaerolineae bacterium SM23_84]|nr:MAG: hypothetical protein AMJ93_09175 [Anaerolineae bacterium SM23_84]